MAGQVAIGASRASIDAGYDDPRLAPYRNPLPVPTEGITPEGQQWLKQKFEAPPWVQALMMLADVMPMMTAIKSGATVGKLTPAIKRMEQMFSQAGLDPAVLGNEIETVGGFSVHPRTGERPSSGLMVAKRPEGSSRVTVVRDRPVTGGDVLGQAANTEADWARNENYLGGFKSPQNQRRVIETSRRFDVEQAVADEIATAESKRGKTLTDVQRQQLRDKVESQMRRTATKYGEGTGQEAGWDAGAQEEFPIGNVYDFLGSPEFQQRLDEMFAAGQASHGSSDWWSLLGGPLERVFGKDALRQVAGFLASTSPESNPTQNLRYASEYIRRWRRGEPIIQPEFRIPETAVGFKPGGKMYSEATRVDNLTKAAEGDIDALRMDKVNDMAHALLGDKNVSVLDRRYAKLGEVPERGIYMSEAKDKIDPSMDVFSPYAKMQNAIKDAAKRHGMTESEFSAIVWEGIGDTIKRTGELYGVKHKAGAIPEMSGGFNPLFTKLVAEKAKAWGLSVEEFERRLRAGNAELLGTVLATPVGWEMYQRSQSPQGDPRAGSM